MRVVLANAFSINMLSRECELLEFRKVNIEKVKEILQKHDFESAIGHKSTTNFLSKLLNVEIKANRVPIKIDDDTVLIVAQLKARLPEGKVLTEEEIAKIPIEFWIVSKAWCSEFGGGFHNSTATWKGILP